MNTSIYGLAQQVVEEYRNNSQNADVVEGLEFDMYETIREAEFFTSGHYITGDYDENGDLKPFHDIVTRLLENQRSAEEVDRSDLEITTDDEEYYTRANLISKFNQDWMVQNNIGLFLNEAIEARGKYGGVLIKVTESDDNLELSSVDWNSFNGDPQDLNNGIKVINHFYTPSELMKVAKERGWNLDAAKEAIELYAEADTRNDWREVKETIGKYILVREVTGDMERSFIDDKADDHDYSYQIHYLAGTEFREGDGTERAVSLFSDELDISPYYFLPYKKRHGSSKMLGVGVVERAKHAQVQSNRAAQQYKRSLDFASTHVLQSASKNLKGKNVLTQMKSGAILKVEDGKPISGVDMAPQALAYLDNYLVMWQTQVDRATGTTAIGTGAGEQLSSDMTYRLGAVLDQNAQSSFDLRREEFDILLNTIYRDRIIPFFIRQIRRKKVLKLKFNPEEIKKLDMDVEQYKADEIIMENYFNGTYDSMPPMMKFLAMDEDKQAIMEGLDQQLKKQKSRRSITDFPEGYWEQVSDKLYVAITNERKKKGVMADRVQNVLMQYLQYKPQLDQDPEARKLFNDIVQIAGLDPIDWSNSTPAQVQPQPGQQPTGKTALDNPEQLSAKPQ